MIQDSQCNQTLCLQGTRVRLRWKFNKVFRDVDSNLGSNVQMLSLRNIEQEERLSKKSVKATYLRHVGCLNESGHDLGIDVDVDVDSQCRQREPHRGRPRETAPTRRETFHCEETRGPLE